MKSFDEWYKEAKKLNDDGFSARDFFEAGQQSKQAEVDELRKRIDATEKWIDENKKHIAMGYWEGWTDEQYVDADDLIEVLKGNQS